jgi:hypothetical protein
MIIKRVNKDYVWHITDNAMIFFNTYAPIYIHRDMFETKMVIRSNQTLKYNSLGEYFEIVEV